MQSATFKVNNNILHWVLNTAEANLNQKWIQTIDNWIAGASEPTISQLKDLSQKSRIPFGVFFYSEPPQIRLPLLKFRTINNNSIINASQDLIDTVNSMELKVAWLEDYRRREKYKKVQFVGAGNSIKYKNFTDHQKAKTILKYFDLNINWNVELKKSQNPFKYLRKIISNAGITVESNGIVGMNTHRSLNVNEFRAFVLINDYAPLIFINTKDSKNAQLFSLVHELVHLWYGKPELFNYNFQSKPEYVDRITEQQINKVAEQILFDKKTFIRKWQSLNNQNYSSVEKINHLSSYFKTSPLATAISADNFNLIDQKTVRKVKQQTNNNVKKTKSKAQRGNFYSNLLSRTDRNFARSVINSTEAGDTTYLEAFNLLNVKGTKTYDGLKARLEN